jgi:hypothetical protein
MPNIAVMSQVSKPILGLLLSAVALFAMVMFVFKGGSGSSAPQSPGVYQSAINQAHNAVGTSNAANARLGASVSTTPAASPAKPAAAAHAPATKHATASVTSKPSTGAQSQVNQVEQAIAQHKVVGLLFYNPQASDDVAVKGELAAAATARAIVKVAVPVSDVASFKMVTSTVPVNSSPTLIVIDRGGSASTITGFADRFEIAQRLDDALTGK